MALLIRWVLSGLALLAVSRLIPGFEVSSFTFAMIVAVFIGLANALIRPFIILFTLPINILTLGLFTFAVNAVILVMVAYVLDGFVITDFGAALLGAIVLWAFNIIISFFFHDKE